jgi:hypothetical protein
VTVNGDTTVEPDETFSVNLTSPVGATIVDAQGVGTITNDDSAAGVQAVVWTSMVGVSANSGTLTKTAGTGWGNAGAVSTKVLPSGDGYVEFTATETTTYRMLGLSNGNTSQNWDDVDFGIYLYTSDGVQVWEKGVLKGTFTTYVSGDKLRVSVESGVVKYRKNGTLFYTSSVAPIYPLIVDTSLYSASATLTNSVISGPWATSAPSGGAVVWTSMVGVSANGGSLSKTAGTTWGNAGAVSSQTLASGDGYVEFTATETNTYRLLGLSKGNTNQNWDDIDFGIYLYTSNGVQVWEKGVLKGTFTTYVSGDKLRVAVESGVVKYQKNGVTFYTSLLAPAYPLLVDTSLYTVGATFTNTVVSSTWR